MSLAHEKLIAALRQANATPLTITPQTTALLIIDMQEYYLDPQSPFSRVVERQLPGGCAEYLDRAHTIVIPNLQRLIAHFRAQGLRVLYTTVASEVPGGADLPTSRQRMNAAARALLGEDAFPLRTAPSARIVAPLAPHPEDVVINKTTYSAFASTGLDGILRTLRIETLVIGGVLTHVCVESTAREGSERGYQVILVDDACATFSPEMHEATLLAFHGTFGRTRTTDEMLSLLAQGAF
jgi:biuret amidohydrolase